MFRAAVFVFIISGLQLFIGATDISLPKDNFGEISKTYTVYINYPEYSVQANVLYEPGKLNPKLDYIYYWYTDNDIKQTQGGFDGRLLHGEYKSFYLNKNLKEQGIFTHGLKDGLWKTWYDNGKIHEVIHYRNSLQHGEYLTYDKNGLLISKSNFKNGVQNKKATFYKLGKIDSVTRYKHGQIVMPKATKNPEHSKSKGKTIIKNDSLKSDPTKTKSSKKQDSINTKSKKNFQFKKIFNTEDSVKQKKDSKTKNKKSSNKNNSSKDQSHQKKT